MKNYDNLFAELAHTAPVKNKGVLGRFIAEKRQSFEYDDPYADKSGKRVEAVESLYQMMNRALGGGGLTAQEHRETSKQKAQAEREDVDLQQRRRQAILPYLEFTTGVPAMGERNREPRLADFLLTLPMAIGVGKGLERADDVVGAYATRKSVRKGFEEAAKDPMFAGIPFEEASKFVKRGWMDALASYSPSGGRKMFQDAMVVSGKPTFKFRERTLSELLPEFIRRKKYGESLVRHEGRHYMQNLEGASNIYYDKLAPSFGRGTVPTIKSAKGYTNRPLQSGAAGEEYSTLINIPSMKNWKKAFPKKAFDSKGTYIGGLDKRPKMVEQLTKKHGASYAKKYMDWYENSFLKRQEYLSEPIEIEARIEEIASLGKKNLRAYSDLVNDLGFSKQQVKDMVSDYTKEKMKFYK